GALTLAVALELLEHERHLRLGQEGGLAQLKSSPVHGRERLDLDGEGKRRSKRIRKGNHSMMGHEASLAAGQRLHYGARELLGPERRVGGTANVGPTGH